MSLNSLFRSLVLFIALLVSCIDRIDIVVPSGLVKGIIVDGLITDQPGPYSVDIRYQTDIYTPLAAGLPFSAKKVELIEDTGKVEELEEISPGVYQTSYAGIQGTVGRIYLLRITGRDGSVFESTPERLNPVGEIDSIYFNFETRKPVDGPTEYGYRIFVDSRSVPDPDAYVRWRFQGTYVVETRPRYHVGDDGCSYDPLPCSGYDKDNQFFKQCTCCRCYVPQFEEQPKVSDNRLVKMGRFVGIEVGYVPVNYYTFYERYRVEVQQMSLSGTGFAFWNSVREQKEGVTSLFQPLGGEILTNLRVVKGEGNVSGLFTASALRTKQIYLDQATRKVDIQTPVDCLGRVGPSGQSCLEKFANSSTTKPADWID